MHDLDGGNSTRETGDGVTVGYAYEWGLRQRDRRRVHWLDSNRPGSAHPEPVAGRLAVELSIPLLIEDRSVRSYRISFCAFVTRVGDPARDCVVRGGSDDRGAGRRTQDGKGIPQAVVFVQEPAERRVSGAQPAARWIRSTRRSCPACLPIVVGTQVKFPNRDQIRHHVYSFSRAKRFELPLYKGEEAPPVLFDKAGVVKIGCNIHDWMSAIILVLPTSHYAVTDERGTLRAVGARKRALHAGRLACAEPGQDGRHSAAASRSAASDPESTFKLSLAPVRCAPRDARRPMGRVGWWSRSRLRTRIFLAFSALVLAVLLATLGFTQYVVSRDAKRTLNRELLTTGEVFDGLLAERAARLETNSILLASDFALKSIIATHFDPATYDPATLASAALSYSKRIGVDLLWITDEAGALLVSSRRPSDAVAPSRVCRRSGRRSRQKRPRRRSAQSDDTLFQLVAVPVFGPDVIGFLLLGQSIDDALASASRGRRQVRISRF